jgi:hypothetical protein
MQQGEFSKGEHPKREIPFSIDVKGGEIETLIRSIMSDNWLRLMDSWSGMLVFIDVNPWRVILYIYVNP